MNILDKIFGTEEVEEEVVVKAKKVKKDKPKKRAQTIEEQIIREFRKEHKTLDVPLIKAYIMEKVKGIGEKDIHITIGFRSGPYGLSATYNDVISSYSGPQQRLNYGNMPSALEGLLIINKIETQVIEALVEELYGSGRMEITVKDILEAPILKKTLELEGLIVNLSNLWFDTAPKIEQILLDKTKDKLFTAVYSTKEAVKLFIMAPTEEEYTRFYREVCEERLLEAWSISAAGYRLENREDFIRTQVVLHTRELPQELKEVLKARHVS